MKFKRIICAALCGLMVAGSFTACGKEEKTKITNVFKEINLELPEEYSGENFWINSLYGGGGDCVYAVCNNYDEETYESENFLLQINADGTVGNKYSFDLEEIENGGSYFQNAYFAEDGTFWVSIYVYQYDEEEGYKNYNLLRHYSEPGSDTYETLNLSDYVDDDDFYLNYVESTSDGKLIIGDWQRLKLIDPETNTVKDFEFENDDVDINNIFKSGDKIYAMIYNYDDVANTYGYTYYELDIENLKLGDEHTAPYNAMYNMFTGPGYDFYYNDSNSVWAGNFDSEEQVEIFNFINSDVDGSDVYSLVPLSADKFFALGYDEETYSNVCRIYERIPDDQIAEREVLTLATPRLTYVLRSSVIKFNKSNDKYRIVVNDYSRYATEDDYNAGASRLTTDLTAGELPDIIQITDALPYESLASKKLFADLYEFMDSDESFDRSKYFENIFEACETDGKLYTLIPNYRVITFAAKTSNLDGLTNWNIEEFMQYVANHPDMKIFDYDFNRANFLEYILEYTRDNFIDRDTGECKFNSDEFKALLEFANTLTTDDFWSNIDYNEVGEDFWNEYENRYVDDSILLSQAYFNSLYSSYRSLVNYTFQDDVTLIGFPSEDGNGAAISPAMELAVVNRSKHKDGAWEFLKSFISEDAQMPTETKWGWDYGNGLPVLRASIEKQLEIAMTPPEEDDNIYYDEIVVARSSDVAVSTEAVEDGSEDELIDADGDGVIDSIVSAETDAVTDENEDTPADEIIVPEDDMFKRINYLTQKQADDLMALIEGVTQVFRSDDKLNSIVTEEAEAYFSGQKSLDEVVGIIQNRAETYIAESR